MAMMMGKLYTALRSANVPDDQAQDAAEEIAGYESRFTKIEADLLVLKLMTAFVITLLLAGFGKLIFGMH